MKQLEFLDQHIFGAVLKPWVVQAAEQLKLEQSPVLLFAEAKQDILQMVFARLLDGSEAVLCDLQKQYLAKEHPLLALDARLATEQQRKAAVERLRREFKNAPAFLPRCWTSGGCPFSTDRSGTKNARHEVAISKDSRGGALFAQAPLLSSYFSVCIRNVSAFVQEFLARIALHRDEIAQTFFEGRAFSGIMGCCAELADLHRHGRCTVIVATDQGRFVYKPHDCRIDVQYHQFTERFFGGITKAPRCIASDGYGFCEFMEAKPVSKRGEVEQYYWNLGSLCALFQAIGSIDLHSENLIAQGTKPVLVDVETVLTPQRAVYTDQTRFIEPEPKEGSFAYDLGYSLVGSSILPARKGTYDGSFLLDDREEQNCLPVLNGEKQPVWQYQRQFEAGFAAGYDRCIQLRDTLSAALDSFAEVPVRAVLRPTMYYAEYLTRLKKPAAMRSRGAQEEIVRNMEAYFRKRGMESYLDIAEAEKNALLEGDVPYFYTLGDSTDLMAEGNVICPSFFRRSPVAHARQRLKRLSEADKRFELDLIRSSLEDAVVPVGPAQMGEKEVRQKDAQKDAQKDTQKGTRKDIQKDVQKDTQKGSQKDAQKDIQKDAQKDTQKEKKKRADQQETACLEKDQALEEAQQMFERIVNRAITAPGGERGWMIYRGPYTNREQAECGAVQGQLGLGVFFAAVSAASKEERVRQKARRQALLCIRQVRDFQDQISRLTILPGYRAMAGQFRGIGGTLRSLALADRYLETKESGVMAQQILEHLCTVTMQESDNHGVISGDAGLLLALCSQKALYETEAGHQMIRLCADRILRSGKFIYGQKDGRTQKLWETVSAHRPVSGMGNGTAGIGAALSGAFRVLKEEKYAEAAETAFAFEYDTFSERLGTWPDLRWPPGSGRTMHGYCSGAPGVGMACLIGMENGIRSVQMEENLQRALHACGTRELLARDHLCCGNSASVDFLLESAYRLQNPVWQEQAGQILAQMRSRKQEKGDYSYMRTEYRPFFDVTLFFGGAGVGYEMLRYANPEKIESLLT